MIRLAKPSTHFFFFFFFKKKKCYYYLTQRLLLSLKKMMVIQVFVEFPNGSCFCTEIKPKDNGFDLKSKVAKESGTSVGYLDLYFEGEVISDSETLMKYGIESESEITASVSKLGTAMSVLHKAKLPVTTDALIDEARRGGRYVPSFIDAGIDPNSFGESQKTTALIAASLQGHSDTISLLIDSGACPDVSPPVGFVALVNAAGAQQTKAVKTLIQKGADVNAASSSGYTALINSIYSNNTEIAAMLCLHGADVNLTTKRGVTPIMAAVQVGNFDVIKMLMEATPPPDLKAIDDAGDDVFVYARDSDDDRIEMALNNNFDFDVVSVDSSEIGDSLPLLVPLFDS